MDIKTLILALALGNLSLCAVLFFFEYERKQSSGMSTWAVARQCQALAWCLLYLRGVLPDLLTMLMANSLLFAGMAFDAGAWWQACGRSRWRRVLLPVLGVAVALFAGAYLLDAAPVVRSAIAALIVAGFLLAGVAALCLKWREASVLRRFLAVSMGLLSLLIAMAGLLSVLAPGLDGAWLHGFGALYFVVLYLVMLTNAFGYLLLSREKLGVELARLEVLDTATGVPNRHGFYQALAPWMALARRPGLPTALVVLKIDHFKRVNDSYGHPVGDAVLKTIVDICRLQLRDSDLMGRLGGAQFAIQLPRTTLPDALMVAERIRAAVASLPVKTERAVLNLTASLGVTTVRADDSMVSLFKRADEALQAARQAGRNQVAEAGAGITLEV